MNAIAAVNTLQYIGKQGNLLYSIKEDMAFFVAKTKGKTVVMGRKTLLSLPGGKGLKGRKNFVLSRSMTAEEAEAANVTVLADPEALLLAIKEAGIPSEDVFVIGGGEVYKLLLPYCDTLYITRVEDKTVGDVSFPDIPSDFSLIKGEMKHSDGFDYSFDTYVRQHS